MSDPNPDKSKGSDFSSMRNRGWVSLRDFCKIADVTYPTALRWCKLDMILFVQVGGTKRIYEEEIARFIQHGTLKADPEKRQAEKDKRTEYKQNAEQQRRNQNRT